ncbi:gamma-glutamylcyclotransferase family protein [Oceaniradius stylonematis]|jgi:gamma-glutamylcyclotransferase|uniref:gamma-glutamylcyclotransferase family protein n=1 Tax=Oceaniradius stylonematis TaxID=2184161 RepID=UPI0035CF47F8
MNFLYFAYGSNMLPARLQARCASARVIGAASAPGFDLEFSKLSKKDGSGKATLVTAADIATPGVLFEIDKANLGALDRAEGAGFGYDRADDFTAEITGTGERITATTYIASATDRQLKPFDWYLALVIAGAQHHALGDDHVARLRLIEHLIDEEYGRTARRKALEALLAHGFDDHLVLLKKAESDSSLSATE